MQFEVIVATKGRCNDLALASLEAWVHLVDDVHAAFAANQTVGAMAAFQ